MGIYIIIHTTVHTTKFVIHLDLIKLQDIYQIEIAKFMYSYIHSTLPVSNIFIFTHHIHNHDTRQLRYIHPISSSTVSVRSSNSILYKSLLIWNKVPYDIKSKPNVKSCQTGYSHKALLFK